MIRRLFCALVAVTLICCSAFAEDAQLVRLHVVAADDGPEAQALKLQLRDTCLRCAEICIGDAPDADAAYLRLQDHLADFQAACEDRARELGYDGSITAEAGVFPFPDRVYGGVLVPAGNYRALKITIGEGEGHNWWCILYPTLCMFDESAGDDPDSIFAWLKSRIGGK